MASHLSSTFTSSVSTVHSSLGLTPLLFSVQPLSRTSLSSPALCAVRCQAGPENRTDAASRRTVCAASLAALAAVIGRPWIAPKEAMALLDLDDDDELLEKVKQGRKSKILKRESLGSYKSEAATVQKAVYKLGFAGQALEESDFATASVVLGSGLESGWTKELTDALAKVSSNAEEKAVASSFSSSLESLQAAVLKDDVDGAKGAYIKSVTSLEKWTSLTGLLEGIQGF